MLENIGKGNFYTICYLSLRILEELHLFLAIIINFLNSFSICPSFIRCQTAANLFAYSTLSATLLEACRQADRCVISPAAVIESTSR